MSIQNQSYIRQQCQSLMACNTGCILNTNYYLNLNGRRAADHDSYITNMCQFEGWRKVEDGAVDAAITVCLSSTFCFLKFELGAYVFLCIKGDMDQLVYNPP
jgi:hypothetical protein